MSTISKSTQKIFCISISVSIIISSFLSVHAAPLNYGEELKKMPEQNIAMSFPDVPSVHWAYTYIGDMVNRKVMGGYPDGLFRPDKIISRAEFAKIIVLAAGLQAKKVEASSFSDIKSTDWCSPYVEVAKDYLTGYRSQNGDMVFRPDSPALREDIAVAMIKMKKYDIEFPDRSIIQAMFDDYDGISEQAKDCVAIAVEKGLMSGFPDNTFRAQQSLDRAQSATLLYRAFKYGDNSKSEVKVVPKSTPAPTVMPIPKQTPIPIPTQTPIPTLIPTIAPVPTSQPTPPTIIRPTTTPTANPTSTPNLIMPSPNPGTQNNNSNKNDGSSNSGQSSTNIRAQAQMYRSLAKAERDKAKRQANSLKMAEDSLAFAIKHNTGYITAQMRVDSIERLIDTYNEIADKYDRMADNLEAQLK